MIAYEVRKAQAALKPCVLYAYHAPAPVETEGHHWRPVYLQNRLYGKIVDNTLIWLCGNCHSAVHAWLYYLMGERRRPDPEPGRKAKAEAERTLTWYQEALAAKQTT